MRTYLKSLFKIQIFEFFIIECFQISNWSSFEILNSENSLWDLKFIFTLGKYIQYHGAMHQMASNGLWWSLIYNLYYLISICLFLHKGGSKWHKSGPCSRGKRGKKNQFQISFQISKLYKISFSNHKL